MVFSLIVSTFFWVPISSSSSGDSRGNNQRLFLPQEFNGINLKTVKSDHSQAFFQNAQDEIQQQQQNQIIQPPSTLRSNTNRIDRGSWDNLQLQRDGEPDPEQMVVPAHRDLQPDFHELSTRQTPPIVTVPSSTLGLKSRQLKENIRSVISGLDPVIPLHPKKTIPKSTTTANVIHKPFGSGAKIKFNGPENPRQRL